MHVSPPSSLERPRGSSNKKPVSAEELNLSGFGMDIADRVSLSPEALTAGQLVKANEQVSINVSIFALIIKVAAQVADTLRPA